MDALEGEFEMRLSKVTPPVTIVESAAGPESLRGVDVARLPIRGIISEAPTAAQKHVRPCLFFRG